MCWGLARQLPAAAHRSCCLTLRLAAPPPGEPSAPTSAAIVNTDAASPNVVVEFDAPSADVAAGYYLTLRRWSQGAVAATEIANVVDVTTTPGGSNIMLAVPHSLVAINGPKWQVSVARSGLYCGTTQCLAGKFSLESFGALSLFQTNGTAAESFTAGKKVAQAGLPVAGAFAYYGEGRPALVCRTLCSGRTAGAGSQRQALKPRLRPSFR